MSEHHANRVRAMCLALPQVTERLSHGMPTFFVGKRVFTWFAGNHHDDGRVAVWLPVPFGLKEGLLESSPETFFNPPYVGVRGWIGIELSRIEDADLQHFIQQAWMEIAPKKLRDQSIL